MIKQRWARPLFYGLLLFTCLGMTACGGCDENNGDTDEFLTGSLSVTPNQVAFPLVNVGAEDEQLVFLRNTSGNDLIIRSLKLVPRDGGSIDGLSVVGAPSLPATIEGFGGLEFRVKYAPKNTAPNRGRLEIGTSDPNYTPDKPYLLDINTLEAAPILGVLPEQVRFAKLAVGRENTSELTLRNNGSAPLVIYEEPTYAGGQDFTVSWPARTYPVRLEVYDAEQAEANPEKYQLVGAVRYRPIGQGADSGEISVISNDITEADPNDETRGIRKISVGANTNSACIFVDSTARNLGQTPIGTAIPDIIRVQNCGQEVLKINAIRITQNSADNEFSLDLNNWDQNADQELDQDVELQPNEEGTFVLKYVPAAEGADQGTITIYSNDPVQPELEINMVGRGADGVCPNAEATGVIRGSGASPRTVISASPLDYVILDGNRSSDDGAVVDWKWYIKKKPLEDPTPVDNLPPTREDPNNTDNSRREVRLLLAGEYVFGLKAVDNEGFESCNEAEVTVVTIPNEKISVELTWTNPEDGDEADEVGADVDVHLVKMGPGKWFDAPYDIYFRNPNNGPGSDNNGIWNPESPSLDRDDTDGGGPETIQMNDPGTCEWYAIGVHYYRQLFGTAYVTVRVYIDGDLLYENTKALKKNGQFWDVARIHWDSRKIFDVNNLLSASPMGLAPEVSPEMSLSGLCTNAMLY